jgi:hypothetical protein
MTVGMLAVVGALVVGYGVRPGTESVAQAATNAPVWTSGDVTPPVGTLSQENLAALRQKFPMIGSTTLYRAVAQTVGTTMGRRLNPPQRGQAPLPPSNEIDHIVSGDLDSIFGDQTEPSIAVHPFDPNIVVAAGHNTNNFSGVFNACSVYESFDGGVNFTYTMDLPLAQANPYCSDTVVRFSPDGVAIYYTWLDIGTDGAPVPAITGDSLRIGVASAFTPSTLLTILQASTVDPNLLDKQWLDVHTFDNTGSGGGFSYLTYTFFTATNCEIWFQRFDGYLGSVGPGGMLAQSTTCGNLDPLTRRVLQGSRPAAGPGQEVLVCWYDSGTDGWSTGAAGTPLDPPVPLNRFNIACRSSNDRGATFFGGTGDPETTPGNWFYAAKAVANEVAFYLGPMTTSPPFGYFKISGAQFPVLAIDHVGNAHLSYTYNPTTNRFGTEQGNVGYSRSITPASTPPYSIWKKGAATAGFGAQFFSTLVAQKVWESPKPYIYLGYNDAAISSKLGAGKANSVFQIKYKRASLGGPSFGRPVLVTDHASLSDYFFLGDYIDSSANNGIYHIIWTDNRFATNIFQDVAHFFSDRY